MAEQSVASLFEEFVADVEQRLASAEQRLAALEQNASVGLVDSFGAIEAATMINTWTEIEGEPR